jgi:ABC-type multidrug transport system, ATPase component
MSTTPSAARHRPRDHAADVDQAASAGAARKNSVPGRASGAQPALVVEGIHKHFGKVKAVNGISFNVNRGEIVALLGPNGAGKTTTLDMALDLSRPTSGSISVFGGSPREAIDNGRLSALLQSGGLLREYTVRETICMVAGMVSVKRPIEEIMERTDLTNIAKRQIGKCSGGEQQRVRFALALLSDPDFLILDEPTAGMDVNARRRFWEAMRAEADNGKTIIFATHYLAEAEAFAPRTIIMNQGKIVADGNTNQIRHNFGTQRINLTFDAIDQLTAASAHMAHRATVSRTGETLTISGPDTVALVREVMTLPGIASISVTDQSLEEAFEHLTDGVDGPAGASPKES